LTALLKFFLSVTAVVQHRQTHLMRIFFPLFTWRRLLAWVNYLFSRWSHCAKCFLRTLSAMIVQ